MSQRKLASAIEKRILGGGIAVSKAKADESLARLSDAEIRAERRGDGRLVNFPAERKSMWYCNVVLHFRW